MPEVTQEQWEKMTPEERKELEKKNCIFCKMIAEEIPTFNIYEDDKCIAILDINPAEEGHVLLLPREHYQILPLVPNEIIGHLGIIAKKISAALLNVFKLKGTSILFEVGQAAGQKSPHVLMHIIPAKENNLILKPKNVIQDYDKLMKLKTELRKKLGYIEKKDNLKQEVQKEKKKEELNTENTKKTEIKKDNSPSNKNNQIKKETQDINLDEISAMFK